MWVLGLHFLFTLTSFPKCSHWAQLPPILQWLPSLQHVFSPDFTNELQTHTSCSVISTATYRLLKFSMSKMKQMAFLLTWFSFAICYCDWHYHSLRCSFQNLGCRPLYSFFYPPSICHQILLIILPKPIYFHCSELSPLSPTPSSFFTW